MPRTCLSTRNGYSLTYYFFLMPLTLRRQLSRKAVNELLTMTVGADARNDES